MSSEIDALFEQLIGLENELDETRARREQLPETALEERARLREREHELEAGIGVIRRRARELQAAESVDGALNYPA